MTQAPTRPAPGDLAAFARRSVPAPTTASRPADAPPYDRARWEQAVMDSGLHFTTRLVALVLAHHAHDGQLPAGGVQQSKRMRQRTGLGQERARQCLRDLEKAGFISRPSSGDWEARDKPRPVLLIVPGVGVPDAAGMEPAHTGEPR